MPGGRLLWTSAIQKAPGNAQKNTTATFSNQLSSDSNFVAKVQLSLLVTWTSKAGYNVLVHEGQIDMERDLGTEIPPQVSKSFQDTSSQALRFLFSSPACTLSVQFWSTWLTKSVFRMLVIFSAPKFSQITFANTTRLKREWGCGMWLSNFLIICMAGCKLHAREQVCFDPLQNPYHYLFSDDY